MTFEFSSTYSNFSYRKITFSRREKNTMNNVQFQIAHQIKFCKITFKLDHFLIGLYSNSCLTYNNDKKMEDESSKSRLFSCDIFDLEYASYDGITNIQLSFIGSFFLHPSFIHFSPLLHLTISTHLPLVSFLIFLVRVSPSSILFLLTLLLSLLLSSRSNLIHAIYVSIFS